MRTLRYGVVGAIVLALNATAVAVPNVTITGVVAPQAAHTNDTVTVSWMTHSTENITSTYVYWGTASGQHTHFGTGTHSGLAGDRAFSQTFQVPSTPGIVYYVVHAKNAAGASIDSAEGTINVTAATPPPSSGPLTFSVSPNLAIPDNSNTGATAWINVPNVATVSAVEVKVDIPHTYRGDLSIDLTAPDGTTVRLVDNGDDSTANIKGTIGLPTSSLTASGDMTKFKGKSTKGTWKLKVVDHEGQDTGTIKTFGLTIYVQGGSGPPPPPPPGPESLPEMVMQPPTDLSIDNTGGKKILNYSTTLANLGAGPLSFRGHFTSSKVEEFYQQIFRLTRDSSGKFKSFEFVREAHIATFNFPTSPGDTDTHFKGWATGSLVKEDFQPVPNVTPAEKVTFSIQDVTEIDGSLEGAGESGNYNGSFDLQGISVGWADTYGSGLDGQAIDITGVPNGTYYLVLEGSKIIVESNTDKTNNDAAARIKIQGNNVTVLETFDGPAWKARKSGGTPPPPPPPAAPTITSITPSSGPAAGNTNVTIRGTGFTNNTSIAIGNKNLVNLHYINATTMTGTTPSGTGSVRIVAANANGTSSQAINFTYQAAPPPPPTVSYSNDIQPIWNAKCTGCHQSAHPAAPFTMQGSAGYTAIVNHSSLQLTSMNRVTPGDPAHSYLWLKMNNTHHAAGGSGAKMPPSGSLTAADLDKVKKWIEQGAPNN